MYAFTKIRLLVCCLICVFPIALLSAQEALERYEYNIDVGYMARFYDKVDPVQVKSGFVVDANYTIFGPLFLWRNGLVGAYALQTDTDYTYDKKPISLPNCDIYTALGINFEPSHSPVGFYGYGKLYMLSLLLDMLGTSEENPTANQMSFFRSLGAGGGVNFFLTRYTEVRVCAEVPIDFSVSAKGFLVTSSICLNKGK
jgi:hypothetical protein